MKISFWMQSDNCGRPKELNIQLKMTHSYESDQIYISAYKINISKPIELSMFKSILNEMELSMVRFASEKLNLMTVNEEMTIEHLKQRIQFLEHLRERERFINDIAKEKP